MSHRLGKERYLMVTTKSGSDTNRVTITNNFAKYYADSALEYANQAKMYADDAKQTESDSPDIDIITY